MYITTSCVAAETWDINMRNETRRGAITNVPRPKPPGPFTTSWIWPCKDGEIMWTILLAGGAQAGQVASSKALVEMMDRDGMAGHLKEYDWSQLDTSQIPAEEIKRHEKVIGNFFLTKTKAELFEEAVKKSILLAPVRAVKDVLECPQLGAREFFVKVEHPELGDTITYPGAPVKASPAPWRVYRRAPLIGEHNYEVYEKELGFSKEHLAILKSNGVI